MQASLTQEFNKTAAAAQEAFPKELRRLVVFLLPSDAPVYVSPDIARKLTKDVGQIQAAVTEMKRIMKENRYDGYADSAFDFAGTTVKLIALKASPRDNDAYTKEM